MSTALRLKTGEAISLVAAFGPEDAAEFGLDNWSLRTLQEHGDVPNNQLLVKALSQEFCGMGVTEAFAPNVTRASGKITETKDMLDHIWLDHARTLRRNRYIHADGLFLGLGQAFAASAAGCGILIASAGEHLCVAHAGRDSLIDRGAVIGKPKRHHLSVVNAVVEQFKWREIEPSEITATLLFSIPARAFEHNADHPVHGAYNRALANFVDSRWPGGIHRENGKTFLDLEQVFVEQTLQAGITKTWAAHSLAEHPRLAHTRDGKSPDRRNLIIVKRES
jgi:copper oxidase (laccase) domain-containing protein